MSSPSSTPIPRGIEVLVKKAAVDPEFRAVLLEHRGAAAEEIDLELGPSEAMMLRAVPRRQLEAIIARTSVPEEHRRAFLGQVAGAMLAALGVGATVAEAGFGIGAGGGIRVQRPPSSRGIQPDRPDPRPAPEPLGERPPERPLTVAERVFKILREMFPNAVKAQGAVQGHDHPTQKPGDGGHLGRKDPPRRARQARPEAAPKAPPGGRPEPPQPPVAPIPPETRLVEDLGAKPRDVAELRKRLESEFEIKLPYRTFGRLRAVGQLVEHVETAVRRRERARQRRGRSSQPRPVRPQPQPRPQSFGIRPDRPPALGGIRPN